MAGPPWTMTDADCNVALGPSGERWQGMSVPGGHKTAVYHTPDNSRPCPPINHSELVNSDTPPDPEPPDPDPDPQTLGDGMDIITNESQLRDALHTYANEQRVGSCGSKTQI